MSFDDYGEHIIQKHRLAVSIAIIKTKPENLTINQYIEDLKTNINKMDDLDITLCSDDFNFDEEKDEKIVENDEFNDSATILKDFDNDLNKFEENIYYNDQNVVQDTQITFCESLTQNVQTCRQIHEDLTYCDEIQSNQTGCLNIYEIDNLKKVKNQKIDCHNENFGKNHNDNKKNSKNEKFTKPNSASNVNKLKTNDHLVEYNTNITKNICRDIKFDTNKKYVDSQETQLYTVPEFTQKSHYSQTQGENIVIPQKYIINKAKQSNIKVNKYNKDNMNITVIDCNTDADFKSIETNKSQNAGISHGYQQSMYRYEYPNDISTFCDELEVFPNKKCIIGNITQLNDSNLIRIQSTQIYNDLIKPIPTENSKNVDLTDINLHNFENHNVNLQTYEEITQTMDTTTNVSKSKENTQDFETQTMENGQIYENANIITDSDQSFEHGEVVPFKILEELSKIKNYLLKRNERKNSYDVLSSDSGYRSNSQSKHSERTFLQNANNWVNQSAYTLFNYIKSCPVNANTNDIADEISHILGQLVDRLHEEETYPTFLEELLEHVKLLLENILKTPNIEEEVLLKEEYTHRLLLLNRSLHIVKYTIEKLTDTLENIQAKITDKNIVYEVSNTTEIENLSYIFHTLEILIRRYVKNKNLSQTTLLSQESSIKKSSITDMWRKKWNPDYKENFQIEGSCEKKCVLLKCTEVLNKIILNCMEGYSLISYSALQCFNVLQQD